MRVSIEQVVPRRSSNLGFLEERWCHASKFDYQFLDSCFGQSSISRRDSFQTLSLSTVPVDYFSDRSRGQPCIAYCSSLIGVHIALVNDQDLRLSQSQHTPHPTILLRRILTEIGPLTTPLRLPLSFSTRLLPTMVGDHPSASNLAR